MCRPLIGPAVSPRCPWPKPYQTLPCSTDAPSTGSESGVAGRLPIQGEPSSARMSRNAFLAWARSGSMRFQLGGASRPANSAVPASRRPICIGVAMNLRS